MLLLDVFENDVYIFCYWFNASLSKVVLRLYCFPNAESSINVRLTEKYAFQEL